MCEKRCADRTPNNSDVCHGPPSSLGLTWYFFYRGNKMHTQAERNDGARVLGTATASLMFFLCWTHVGRP